MLPLTNILLPANVMTLYEPLVQIVAFDYVDMYDPGFTKTEPYSYRFNWFGFGSTNYVLALGTAINFLIFLMLVKTLTALLIHRIAANQE